MSIAQTFRDQAAACEMLGSPFMGRLMGLCAERLRPGMAVADLVLGWSGDPSPSADSVPLRLAGALHALRLRGVALTDVYPPKSPSDDALWAAVAEAMVTHEADILDWMTSAPQTNEVRRSGALIPVLHLLTQRYGLPLHLSELGASGGLNLRADRYRLDLGGHVYGPEASPVRLAPEMRGGRPPVAPPVIAARAGVDLNPLHPEWDADRLRLLAYLWPDQADRAARTRAAIEIARDAPVPLAAGDAVDWLEAALARPRPGALHLIYHTIAWQYFPAERQAKGAALLEAAGARATADAPLAHFSMEADGAKGAALTLRCWPGGTVERLGRVDFHGIWLDWQETHP